MPFLMSETQAERAAGVAADWREDALCLQVDPGLMDADDENRGFTQAKLVCAKCPVAVECLAEAMAVERGWSRQLRHTIRGGVTATARGEWGKELREARATLRDPSPLPTLVEVAQRVAVERAEVWARARARVASYQGTASATRQRAMRALAKQVGPQGAHRVS